MLLAINSAEKIAFNWFKSTRKSVSIQQQIESLSNKLRNAFCYIHMYKNEYYKSGKNFSAEHTLLLRSRTSFRGRRCDPCKSHGIRNRCIWLERQTYLRQRIHEFLNTSSVMRYFTILPQFSDFPQSLSFTNQSQFPCMSTANLLGIIFGNLEIGIIFPLQM